MMMERCHILSSQYVRLSKQDIWISLIIWVISSLGLAFYEKHLQATITQDLFDDGFYLRQLGQLVDCPPSSAVNVPSRGISPCALTNNLTTKGPLNAVVKTPRFLTNW
jgi:hypothetical protein